MLAITPCMHLPMKYFFIDKSVCEIILKTCSKTEIPPKPSKNADKIIFCDTLFIFTKAVKLTPFVSSKIPQSSGWAKLKFSKKVRVESLFVQRYVVYLKLKLKLKILLQIHL